MDRKEIITVLEELHKISGFRVSLHGTDFKEIAAYPNDHGSFCKRINSIEEEHSKCIECDKYACHEALRTGKTYIYKCRFGLTEAVSPLYNFGTLTGFLMMGQVLVSEDGSVPEEALRSAGALTFEDILSEIPIVEKDMLFSYVKIMTICTQYLTLSNAVISERKTIAEEAAEYIEQNLDKKLGIAELCKRIGCSKSTLISSFKRRYGTTVNDFIVNMKLKKAEGLLAKGKGSIAEISTACGFTDQSYFSKVFSAKYGLTPTEFRSKC
jgi:AraC-like DNA-binding protein